jgi:hypothetical protein
MNALENWELEIMQLDERLRPIAKRTVDVTDPGWFERLQGGLSPLDEAGVRMEMEKLLPELITAYVKGNEQDRATIRRFFSEYQSFAWVAALNEAKTTAASLRHHLILFSMQDQGQDSRDALLSLREICREAANARVELTPLLREVAAISSTVDKYGMGSTRDMLLTYCNSGSGDRFDPSK